MSKQPIEISPLLLFDDSLLLFARFDDCVAAIDIFGLKRAIDEVP